MAAARQVSVDGALCAPEDARVPVLDDGLLRGDGVFEMIKLYGGWPFRLVEHLDRLGRSAAAIELGFDRPALEREVDALLAALPEEDLALRVVLTRGGRRLLLAEELPAWPASAAVALLTLSPSEILVGVKSISYAGNMQATRIAAGRGADEAVYVDRGGIVLEAPTSAVMWAGSDGELCTPSLECGILDSITRAVLIERLDVREGAYAAEELAGAQEAFLASTTREIQPISAVDGRALGAVPGPRSEAAADALAAAVRAERSE